ncbi:MAG: hypothetical protein A3F11_03895 [Gammaproteobacteria bacterium RIFCSPHIGHO2_12_FULL_37_14]|nr:MAG: hypothetical protein A3F11_03895 [Gammaproteobacteria bacterium RIFCSPHIGHO2_12_FULL_37_14]
MRKLEFANRVLKTLEKFPNDAPAKLNRIYYLESQLSIKELTKLLYDFSQQDEEIISDEQLQLFYTFLEKRKERFIPNRADPKTKADRICTYLANELCIQANSRHYMTRDPNSLLRPTLRDFTGIDPETHLKQSLLNDIANRNKLVTTLLILEKNIWIDYCDNIELSTLMKIASNNKSTIDDVINFKDEIHQDEEYQRASSFIKGYIYHKTRLNGPEFNSYTGAILNFFSIKKIQNRLDKTNATSELLKFLMSDSSLYDLDFNLNDSSGVLFFFRNALIEHGSRLQKIVMELQDFVSLNKIATAENQIKLNGTR